MGRLIALGVAFLLEFVVLFYGGVFIGQNSTGLNLGDYASITLVALILYGAFFGVGTIILGLLWPNLSSFHNEDDIDIVEMMERNDMVEEHSYDKGYADGYEDGIVSGEASGIVVVRSTRTFPIDEEEPTTDVQPSVILAPAATPA